MLTGNEYFYAIFKKSVQEIAELENVVNIGTPGRFTKELHPFTHIFKNNYFALDYIPGFDPQGKTPDVDISGSIFMLPLKDNSIDGALCLSVFEHLSDPFCAARELYRVLKPQGKAFLTIPFMLGEHAKHGAYSDYYRFTRQGVAYLFKAFSNITVSPQGGGVYYRLAMFPALFRMFQNKTGMRIVAYLDRKTRGQTTFAWMILLVK